MALPRVRPVTADSNTPSPAAQALTAAAERRASKEMTK